jgi:hypothetical protein
VRIACALSLLATVACGDDGPATTPDAPAGPDAPPSNCQTQGATGQFIRRAGNPQLTAGAPLFDDGQVDLYMEDPDVHWDGAQWVAYWSATHAESFTAKDRVRLFRRATSTDRVTWTVDEEPALVQDTSPESWERSFLDAPTVALNPDAPADRRYIMLYAAADDLFQPAHYSYPAYRIGAAFSADGRTFTRISAEESPHDVEGLVLTPRQVFSTFDGVIGDPELVVVDGVYHLYFSSFSCSGSSCETPRSHGVAHATSTDGIHWTIVDAPVRSLLRSADLTSGGDKPSVVYDPLHCNWELWLRHDSTQDVAGQPIDFDNMAGLYRAWSTDGETWNVNYAFRRDFEWDATKPGEKLGLRGGADVAIQGYGRMMLYVGFDDTDVPSGFELPSRSGGAQPATMTLDVATRDLP